MSNFYCSLADVGSRIGLDSAQRTRAQTRLENCIRRAAIQIDQCFLDYGRDEPSRAVYQSTLNGAVAVGATTITLADASSFATAGSGNINGDSFSWTGKSSNDLTGCTGISFSHSTGKTVQQGELAHVVREVCADMASGLYLMDEATMQDGDLRGHSLFERGQHCLIRLAHLGKA